MLLILRSALRRQFSSFDMLDSRICKSPNKCSYYPGTGTPTSKLQQMKVQAKNPSHELLLISFSTMASDTSFPPIVIGDNSVVISGAGLAGCLLACRLRQKGIDVHVIERRSDPRKQAVQAGRSINLALSERGINAMRDVGILDDILNITIPMYGRAVHLKGSTDVVFQPYSHDGKQFIRSVSRADLNIGLLNLAEKAGATFHFDRIVRRLNVRTGDMTIDGCPKLRTTTVIAADGAYSPCRHSIINAPFVDYSQKYMEHGYKELVIPPSNDPQNPWRLRKNALHIWPRGTFMMIALPNLDGSFTCTLFMPLKGGFDQLTTPENVQEFFTAQFADAVPLMPTLTHDFFSNPTGSLTTVKCYPWSFGGHLTMVGDAAHAVVPFFGQGMNASFEDVFVLNSEIEKQLAGRNPETKYTDIPWASIFDAYQRLRKVNTDAIADMAEANYIEMRDKVADPQFQLLKQVQDKLGNAFTGQFISKYELVSFSNIPYALAKEKGQIGENIAKELLADAKGLLNDIDMNKAAELINQAFPQGWLDTIAATPKL